jgi:nitroimidazol reductase NimA-like FMN-containing flavoprotein (pyridoxamine 5'-phosphate oxidase superfamily)
MFGVLTAPEIENVLQSQSICNMACTDGKKPYVVPITYYYDGTYIYCQSHEGKKIDILRKNPNVCIQIDIITSMDTWKSAIINGTFEELKGDDAENARIELFSRVMTLMTSSKSHQFEHKENGKIDDSSRIKTIMFKIKIKDKTGRYESQSI